MGFIGWAESKRSMFVQRTREATDIDFAVASRDPSLMARRERAPMGFMAEAWPSLPGAALGASAVAPVRADAASWRIAVGPALPSPVFAARRVASGSRSQVESLVSRKATR